MKAKNATVALASAFRKDVGGRLRELENRFPNRQSAATVAGVAKSTFQNWVHGNTDPSFEGLARVCQSEGVSLDWLAFGEDRAPKNGMDLDLMEEVVSAVGLELEAQGIAVRPIEFGRLSRVVYQLIAESRPEDRRSAIRNVLTLVSRAD